MSKNIVICCDGTGNEIGTTISNVLKLFRVLEKSDRQQVYYNPGVGTIGEQNAWQRWRNNARGVFGLATGYGLDEDVLAAYCFLCRTYEPGDRVWLFGFSRGAYTARVLAAFSFVIGLLPPDQLNLASYAFAAYKRASADSRRQARRAEAGKGAFDPEDGLQAAWHFSRVAGGRPVNFTFLGLWDTVASLIVPRPEALGFDIRTLRFTATNRSVETVRHAIAIDERRRMFRLNRWREPQPHRPDKFNPGSDRPQDIRQVWFAGVHADIGGGYPEAEAALSKYPLQWMIEEAAAKGLHVDQGMVDHLVLGHRKAGSKHEYVEPSVTGPMHNSMLRAWTPLEYLPKKVKWREWGRGGGFLGYYLPRTEPREILPEALVHWSAIARRDAGIGYDPVNLPRSPLVEGKLPSEQPGD